MKINKKNLKFISTNIIISLYANRDAVNKLWVKILGLSDTPPSRQHSHVPVVAQKEIQKITQINYDEKKNVNGLSSATQCSMSLPASINL